MHRALLLLAVVCLAFAPAPFPKPKKPDLRKADLKRMQGEWTCVSFIIAGVRQDLSTHTRTARVKGNLMAFGRPEDTWRLTLDATGVPGRIDFHRVKPLGGIDLIRGVYRLDGDMLTICWRLSKEEKDRPTGFDLAQPNVWVHVYKRQEP
jgi:uncharacterized protein (TIGR03067 family)